MRFRVICVVVAIATGAAYASTRFHGLHFGPHAIEDVVDSPDVSIYVVPETDTGPATLHARYSGSEAKFVPIYRVSPRNELYQWGKAHAIFQFAASSERSTRIPEVHFILRDGTTHTLSDFSPSDSADWRMEGDIELPWFAWVQTIEYGVHFDGSGETSLHDGFLHWERYPYELAAAGVLLLALPILIFFRWTLKVVGYRKTQHIFDRIFEYAYAFTMVGGLCLMFLSGNALGLPLFLTGIVGWYPFVTMGSPPHRLSRNSAATLERK